mmetsp:Transcript_26365/g.66297  ORF Transcript_26365/g.66297 Transcript_26365/m.66297 type:complete len:455 (+) Transcript_26365:112-1476(+)|eukprot:CAMPEP_0177649478 /NCGR_PEP_ID=MMETSP0447-20121125/11416_1 /TAXON_ID=0 /ORGANISM="Stygamoeba regulata, Strain BSH-02190019" /LENGTH=454 /DNA_ID=CAMNT_0019152255 /DNA_START=87 /DNA_END=1451 /DNA_ORIENTATION=-
MRTHHRILLVVLLVVLAKLLLLSSTSTVRATGSFVTRQGNRLLLDGQEFRFSGANIYWLGLDENVGGVRYPTEFRVRDALATAREMGASVVRSHTLGISTGNVRSFERALDCFNESSLVEHIDMAVHSAAEFGLRLVIPLTDDYHYYHGGKYNFTNWRDIADENRFYSDPLVIADFEEYVRQRLLRRNPLTGLRAVDDPTILAWETGNELRPPANWTAHMARFIKSIDPNHLVLDGTYGVNPDALHIEEVDMYSDHYYPMNLTKLASDAALCEKASKVFFVGEYQWSSGDLTSFLRALRQNPAVAGDTYWSLFPHADNYGFVQHQDCCTLHYPGDSAEMRARVQQLRTHAYHMSGRSVAGFMVPPAPLITSVDPLSGAVAWRGAVGADRYSLQVRQAGAQQWSTLCERCATDDQTPLALSTLPVTGSWEYRVWAHGLGAVSGPASPVYQYSFYV